MLTRRNLVELLLVTLGSSFLVDAVAGTANKEEPPPSREMDANAEPLDSREPRRAVMGDGDHIEFQVFGDGGPFVFLGPHAYLSPPVPQFRSMVEGYVTGLKDRYRVILANWPRGVGKSSPARADSLTWQQAVDDIHRIADAAGADRFAWWGYSFGAAVGLQLAPRSERLSALVCGGFPPLWQPLSEMLSLTRSTAKASARLPDNDARHAMDQQAVTFYESVAGYDEARGLEQIRCPRLVFHDVADTLDLSGFVLDLAARTRAVESKLQSLGWETAWVETGQGHLAFLDPEKCLAAFAPFLDKHLLGKTS